MKTSIEKTIKDTAKALKAGVAKEWAWQVLLSEGWDAKQARTILLWAKAYVEKGVSLSPFPGTTITVKPENV